MSFKMTFNGEFLYRRTCRRCYKHKSLVGGGTSKDGKRWYCAECFAFKKAKAAEARAAVA